jgi:3(or 17)beta-hydroxysteroid dehydrogenase
MQLNLKEKKLDRVKGKVALVTGSASGIGKATALLLAKEGAKVIISDINLAGGKEVDAQIKKDGGESCFIKLDVTSERDWVKAMEKIVARFGKLDILVNNAGDALIKSIEDSTVKDFRYIFTLDVEGVFLGTKYAFGVMKNSGGGAIINMSSQAGIKGAKDSSIYCAAKAAVRLFTKSAAVEGSKTGYNYNIRVNSVHPGVIETPLLKRLGSTFKDKKTKAAMDDQIRIGRNGQPIDVARTVLFLASDDASYITGSEFVVDGGMIC